MLWFLGASSAFPTRVSCVCVVPLRNMQVSCRCLSTEGHARLARQIPISGHVSQYPTLMFFFKDHMLVAESRTYCQLQPCSAFGTWDAKAALSFMV